MKAKKMIKIMTALLLVLVTMLGLSVTAFAAGTGKDTSQVTPRWTNIYSMHVNMTFDGTSGNAVGTAIKMSTATRIEGTLQVYKLVGNRVFSVGQWYNSVTMGSLVVSGDFTAQKGYTYIAMWTVTAYTGDTPETETFQFTSTCE